MDDQVIMIMDEEHDEEKKATVKAEPINDDDIDDTDGK
jgi:hypothetical protein